MAVRVLYRYKECQEGLNATFDSHEDTEPTPAGR